MTVETAATCAEPGARWLRCDLHVHTPFDPEKKFGEDIRGAIDALKKAKPERLAQVAGRFVQGCRNAANGEGMDLVAVTDHNSIEGYRYLRPFFEGLQVQARDQGLQMPAILPGVEFSVGGERAIHFLVIFAADTSPDDIARAITHVFGTSDPFDPKSGTPRATGQSVIGFLEKLYEYCRPPSGERSLAFVVLPAHVDRGQGLSKELTGSTGVRDTSVPASIWDEMRGHLRQRTIVRRDWQGFQAAGGFRNLPQAFRELLYQWAAARRSEDWDALTPDQKARYRQQKHWPIVQCSDPHRYEDIGSSFTWLKMEVPDVEGIRLALLDPESRLRRMADGPPSRPYARIERLHVHHTDFFDDVGIPLNPCMTTLIGGRGTGKSTVIEYLRHVLDRARDEDLQDDEPNGVHQVVKAVLSRKNKRDYGEKKGTLLDGYEIAADIVVAERRYRIRRNEDGLEVIQDPDLASSKATSLDVRSLIAPRFLSQRQIARVARNPTSQRRELDALIESNRLRTVRNEMQLAKESIAQLQTTRTRLSKEAAKLATVETELQTVKDQIAFLQGETQKEVFERFDEVERQRSWLEEQRRQLTDTAARLEQEANTVSEADSSTGSSHEPKLQTTWLVSVAQRVHAAREASAGTLREQTEALRALEKEIALEQAERWQADHDEARSAYEGLRVEMVERGIDFDQHEELLERRGQLERELTSLRIAGQGLSDIGTEIRDTRLRLVEAHEARLGARREQAETLEEMDADVRLEVLPFRDRDDFESRREEWFGGAGLQERDWSVLCNYVFAPIGQVPDRIAALAEAIRDDTEATATKGSTLEESASQVVALVDSGHSLTKNFLNALKQRERIRVDEIERFLPEDLVETRVRTPDGSFKTIETGSVGEKSTAILSLLLSAGEQPIIIDQPEDDLDNQYVYSVVVDLLRRRKFSRQVIIATHNANIPVNGDAELIVALGSNNRLGEVVSAGSIDQSEIKNRVSVIMEGSAEAFRLRHERYGY